MKQKILYKNSNLKIWGVCLKEINSTFPDHYLQGKAQSNLIKTFKENNLKLITQLSSRLPMLVQKDIKSRYSFVNHWGEREQIKNTLLGKKTVHETAITYHENNKIHLVKRKAK